jgi:hypothetical protein
MSVEPNPVRSAQRAIQSVSQEGIELSTLHTVFEFFCHYVTCL